MKIRDIRGGTAHRMKWMKGALTTDETDGHGWNRFLLWNDFLQRVCRGRSVKIREIRGETAHRMRSDQGRSYHGLHRWPRMEPASLFMG